MYLFFISVVVFLLGLVVFAFSSCEIRKRSEKKACKAGDVDKCLEVGKYYEDKSAGGGLITFLFSHGDTSIAYYYRACKLKSARGCERMSYMLEHGPDQAKNLSTELTDVADALITDCAERVEGTCDQLWEFGDKHVSGNGNDWVFVRAGQAFDKLCAAGNVDACYWLGRIHGQNRGGYHNVADEVIPLYDKACQAKIKDSCEGAAAYRKAQQDRAAGKAR